MQVDVSIKSDCYDCRTCFSIMLPLFWVLVKFCVHKIYMIYVNVTHTDP